MFNKYKLMFTQNLKRKIKVKTFILDFFLIFIQIIEYCDVHDKFKIKLKNNFSIFSNFEISQFRKKLLI